MASAHATPARLVSPPPGEAGAARAVLRIPLSNGMFALIDECDAYLSAYRWHARREKSTWYAARDASAAERKAGAPKTIGLHRSVLAVTDPDLDVDHQDGNGLDCRRFNLRVADPAQNQENASRRVDNTSGFKGVHWHKVARRWHARIRVRGRRIHLGSFRNSSSAARAYDAAARRFFGRFACVNFPLDGERAA